MPIKNAAERKAYMKTYSAQWHQDNKERRAADKLKRKERLRKWLKSTKERPCTDCGRLFNPICMDYHHESGEKEISLGQAMSAGWAQTRLEAEIAKCVLLCACCHRLRHI